LAKVVEYKNSVEKDLRNAGEGIRSTLLSSLEKKLLEGERASKALSGAFKGLHRIRIGDYRAIYVRTERGFLVLRIAHRKEAYR
jgi:mRNA-degrading endonuclease RelE of RelBE toxin-antitoxin system